MKIIAKSKISLTDLLLQEFKTASKTTVKSRITHGNVRVNGKMATNPAILLKSGDTVEYLKQAVRPSKIKPPCPVLFEDDSILVAEKPAGLLTIGDKGLGGTSFYKIMLDYVKEQSKGKEKIFIVHRLDREVSGLLIMAKSEEVQQQIKAQWHATRKLYYALVEGKPLDEKGSIRTWLAEGRDQKVFSVNVQEGAKLGITHYKVCLLYTSPSPRDGLLSRMPSSA